MKPTKMNRKHMDFHGTKERMNEGEKQKQEIPQSNATIMVNGQPMFSRITGIKEGVSV